MPPRRSGQHLPRQAMRGARAIIGASDMPNAAALTDRFDRALLYATHVHGGQLRKGTGVPYIAHLLAVAAPVLEYDGSAAMAIAALLHHAGEAQGAGARLSDSA